MLKVSEPGTYAVHAFKVDAGYPDVLFAFELGPDQRLERPQIHITKGKNVTGVDVKLGEKCGSLHFQVLDERTEKAIETVDYKLCQARAREKCLNTRAVGSYDVSVPPTEVSVEVSAPGYVPLKYMENSQPFILVKSGEVRELVFKLKPQ